MTGMQEIVKLYTVGIATIALTTLMHYFGLPLNRHIHKNLSFPCNIVRNLYESCCFLVDKQTFIILDLVGLHVMTIQTSNSSPRVIAKIVHFNHITLLSVQSCNLWELVL